MVILGIVEKLLVVFICFIFDILWFRVIIKFRDWGKILIFFCIRDFVKSWRLGRRFWEVFCVWLLIFFWFIFDNCCELLVLMIMEVFVFKLFWFWICNLKFKFKLKLGKVLNRE